MDRRRDEGFGGGVAVWGAEDVQSQLDMVGTNKAIFEKIASSLDRKPWVPSNMTAVQNED